MKISVRLSGVFIVMVDTKNYKKYIAIGSLMMPNSLVGSFRKKDDDSFTCDIIMNDAKVDEAGFITCATTMFPDKAVIYITKDMLEALQQDDEIALFDLYRELGHIECGHFDVPENASEMTQEESLEMMDKQDLEADAFAAEFVGKDTALKVLKELLKARAKADRDLHLNGTPASVQRIRKYRARISALEALQ